MCTRKLAPAALAGIVLGAATLWGCQGGAGVTGSRVAGVLSSPGAASILAQLQTGFAGPAKAVVDKINAGVRLVEADRKYICAGVAMADGLFKIVAEFGLVPGADVSTEGATMVGVNAACSSGITDVASAVGTAATAYLKTTEALKAAGVPVATP